jgi:hypothetical protein
MDGLNVKQLRALLAAEQVSHTQFARACGLSRGYCAHVLAGSRMPGELCVIKVQRCLAKLGLDRGSAHVA